MKKRLLALFAPLALAAVGCGPSYDHLQLNPRTNPPAAVVLLPTQIQLPAGIAVAVTATPMDGQSKIDKELILSSSNPAVFGVARDASGKGFVLFGVSQGEAQLQIQVDGEEEPSIPTAVLAPAN